MNIDKGIITVDSIFGIKVSRAIVESKGKHNVRTLIPMIAKGITVHNTGDNGATALNESKYIQSIEANDTREVGWHFTVDDVQIIQHLPINEKAYHAGDGVNGFGNGHTIGIEIAETSNYKQCEANGIKLICWLMKELNIPIEYVQPHRKYSSIKKLCPWRILKSQSTWETDWKLFQTCKIEVMFNSLYKSNKKVNIIIDTKKLNVRQGPGLDFSIIKEVYQNEQYSIIEEANGWGRITSGWINLNYTKEVR